MKPVTQLNNQTDAVAEAITRVLADTYAVYFKTHAFHWNVEGINFHTLHTLFEEQYTEMWQAIDVIAERIRMLDSYAPSSYNQMAAITTIEDTVTPPSDIDMLKQLITDHEKLITTLKNSLPIAQQAEDEVSVGILLQRMEIHEKTLWMLKSLTK